MSGEFKRIDAHQHFWRVARNDYPWMPESGPLVRDYLPGHLADLNAAAEIGGTVLVQAAPTVAETEYMLGLADAEGPVDVLGVVGWVDLEDSAHAELMRLAAHPRFVGVRPMIQDIADRDWIRRPAVIEGLGRVEQLDLTFDLLCYPLHLPAAIATLEQLPDLRLVVDHLAKPDYGTVDPEWVAGMRALSEREESFCKLAGLVTEVGAGWRIDDFRAHFEVILELFGPDRILIGTDWPVLRLAAEHAEVVQLVDELIAELPESAREAMWAGAAASAYRLNVGWL